MTTDPNTDFDGCHRKCRAQQRHTMEYGRCEHADKPEPTVSMSKICTGPDGYPSIGYDQYTVPQLAELIEPALTKTAPGAWREIPEMAAEAARAIVHRNDGPVVPAVPSPSVEPVLTGTELASLSEGRALARCDRDEALAAVPSAVDRADEAQQQQQPRRVKVRVVAVTKSPALLDTPDDEIAALCADEAQQPETQAEGDTARLAKVVHWVTSEVVTAETEFGNGYREAQRDIRDLIKGRFGSDPKPAVVESGPDEGPRLLFWEESAGASVSDGRVTVPVSRAVNLAEFGPAGDLVLPLQSARTLCDTLSRVLREAATEAPAAGTA